MIRRRDHHFIMTVKYSHWILLGSCWARGIGYKMRCTSGDGPFSFWCQADSSCRRTAGKHRLSLAFARCHAGRCRKPHARTPKQCANGRRQFNREAGEMLERAEAVESAQLKNDAERSEDEHPLSSICINVRWPVQWPPSTSEP